MDKSEAIERLYQYIDAIKHLPDGSCILNMPIWQDKESSYIFLFSGDEVPETYTEERYEWDGYIARYTAIDGVTVKWYVKACGGMENAQNS